MRTAATSPGFGALALSGLLAVLFLSACASKSPELETVAQVDLPRFMGDWYVVANIPTFIEKDAHNAVESYRQNDDGSIATTFRFRRGSFDGDLKELHPTGFVRDTESNAVWGMRFLWPFQSDYRIVWLEPDYSLTVIGRNARDYVWIMARRPEIADDDYERLVRFVESIGYDVSKLQKVPQQWPVGPS